MHPMFGLVFLPLVLALALWTIAIKGYALWHAAKADHKVWFVAILLVNTLGILELVYLIGFRDKTPKSIAPPPAPAPSSSGGGVE